MSAIDAALFRLADLHDADQLADLRWRLKTDDRTEFDTTGRARFVAAFVDVASKAHRDESLFHWVADLDGRLIAVMSIRRVPKVPSPERMDAYWGYLTNCYTLPAYRDQGIGAGLLAEVKRWAREQRFELLVVWPSERSYPFYERCGFRRYPDPLVFQVQDRD